jgi:hypothetical protein
MDETFVNVMDVYCWLTAVTPYYLTCLTEMFLIVGKDD